MMEETFSFRGPSVTFQVRSFFAHFTDLCSTFDKHLAPTYKHDSCERSVKMRLYSLSKRQFLLVFIAFFVAYGLTLIVGLAGPEITQSESQNATGLELHHPGQSYLKHGPFVLKSPPMTTFHQQLWLFARVLTDRVENVEYKTDVVVGVQITGVGAAGVENKIFNRTRSLVCKHVCEELVLLHLGYLDYSSYIISVSVFGLDSVPMTINDIVFTFKSFNPSFTQLEIWFRFVFLGLSFLATCAFSYSLRRHSLRDWSVEQRWLTVLLPLLLLLNDPIFPVSFLASSPAPAVLDALFQAVFVAALLLFWLAAYHAIRQTHRPWCRFYLPKLVLVGLLLLPYVTLSAWSAAAQYRDPTYNYRVDTASFTGLKVFLFVMGGLYLLYLLFLLVKAYADLRNMPYFDLRLKFMTALVVIVVTVTSVLVSLRFGTAALQDNFVAEMTTRYGNSVEFTAMFGLLNCYLLTMAFVYSPSSTARLADGAAGGMKDNPAFSMLDDSDEDVVYGSEEELNERRALNGRRK